MDLKDLEYRCSKCAGKGKIWISTTVRCKPMVGCPACHGTGRELSVEGQTAMDFVVRHLDSVKFRKTISACGEVSNTAPNKNPHWADRLTALATISMLAAVEIGLMFYLAHEYLSTASLPSMDVWDVVTPLR